MHKSVDLISKMGYSFMSDGKVYLGRNILSSDMLVILNNCGGLKYVKAHIIEEPGQITGIYGYSRDFFNDCFGIMNDHYILRGFSTAGYADLTRTINLFDVEEKRWNVLNSGTEHILSAIKEFQNLPDINGTQVLLVKQAVQTKRFQVNAVCSSLNQDSLVKTIYGIIYKYFLIEGTLQMKQEHISSLLEFIKDLEIYSFLHKVKRV